MQRAPKRIRRGDCSVLKTGAPAASGGRVGKCALSSSGPAALFRDAVTGDDSQKASDALFKGQTTLIVADDISRRWLFESARTDVRGDGVKGMARSSFPGTMNCSAGSVNRRVRPKSAHHGALTERTLHPDVRW